MELSNIHRAYGDDSVYQQIVGHKHVNDGDDTTDWNGYGVKLRAVKTRNDRYVSVVRSKEGTLLYEGIESSSPTVALLDAKEWYEKMF